jgi:ferric-dicitrate binding protein FerR (iron transport regulator)
MGRDDEDVLIAPERWARLDDYFSDRLSLADKVEMDRWAAERDDRRLLLVQLRNVWARAETAAPHIGTVDIRKVLNTLAERRDAIDAAARTTPAPVVPLYPDATVVAPRRSLATLSVRRDSRLLRGAAIAATLVIAVGLSFVVRHSTPTPASVVPAAREVATKRGQQATLDLADGSRVVLAAGSRLRIPGDFNVSGPNGTRRELYLEGKAYFAVEHDSTRPFIVRTATAITEDLGTEFVVSAYPESRVTQVVVVSGLVELRRPDTAGMPARPLPPTQLQPGDVGRLDSTGAATVAHNVALAPYVSWTRGVLAFDAVPVREALAELSRWYDVDFELRGNAIDSLRITGEFREEPVKVAMQRLALMLRVRATQNGRTVRLSPKPISP